MKEIKKVFDYGSISEEHKDAAAEIISMCESMEQPLLAELIRQKFKIIPPKLYDIEQSSFVKRCEEHGIFVAVQGFVKDGNDPTQYQIVSINADIRELDKMIDSIKNNE